MKQLRNIGLVAALAVVVLVGGACAKDSGTEVRNGGSGSTVEAASGASGSGSGASGSGSGAAGAAAVKCVPVGDAATATSTLNLTTEEWAIKPSPATASAGKVNIVVDNKGKEAHEVVVVRGTPAEVGKVAPTADGSFDEAAYGEDKIVGEIEAFPAGETCNGVFELTAGDYTLICNIVETASDGTKEAHVHEGMVTALTVS